MRKINNINELNFIDKIGYAFQFVDKDDVTNEFYLHDIAYDRLEYAVDKEKLLITIKKILEKLTYTFINNYDEYVKIMNYDMEKELIPLLEKEEKIK